MWLFGGASYRKAERVRGHFLELSSLDKEAEKTPEINRTSADMAKIVPTIDRKYKRGDKVWCLVCHIFKDVDDFQSSCIVPRKHGGLSNSHNFAPVCSSCNKDHKSTNTYEYIYLHGDKNLIPRAWRDLLSEFWSYRDEVFRQSLTYKSLYYPGLYILNEKRSLKHRIKLLNEMIDKNLDDSLIRDLERTK